MTSQGFFIIVLTLWYTAVSFTYSGDFNSFTIICLMRSAWFTLHIIQLKSLNISIYLDNYRPLQEFKIYLSIILN